MKNNAKKIQEEKIKNLSTSPNQSKVPVKKVKSDNRFTVILEKNEKFIMTLSQDGEREMTNKKDKSVK